MPELDCVFRVPVGDPEDDNLECRLNPPNIGGQFPKSLDDCWCSHIVSMRRKHLYPDLPE